MAYKYLHIFAVFVFFLLIDVFLYRKIKKTLSPEYNHTSIRLCFFIYVFGFLSLTGYLFFIGEKDGDLECLSDTMICEFRYTTPFLYPKKITAKTFDISDVRRASVRKSEFLRYTSYMVVLHEEAKEIPLPMKYPERFLAKRVAGSFNAFLTQREPYYKISYYTSGLPILPFGLFCIIIILCENFILRRLTNIWLSKKMSPDIADLEVEDRDWEEEARETFRDEGYSEEEIDGLINEIYEEDKLYEEQTTTEEEPLDIITDKMKKAEISVSSGLNIPDDVISRSRRD